MISIDNLHKSYGAQTLFEGVSFKINTKERVGLVGRNGHGKTTLFRIIAGEEDYESGAIAMPKGYRIGFVRQHLAFRQATVLAEGMRGLNANERDHHWKVEKILAGLGFSPEDMQRNPLEFSGGFQVRLNLAKVLVAEPDLLLLDEPTNYLDIASIRWIERFLVTWPHELLLITHDRSFMDKIVTHTVGIHRKKARKIAGNTEKYYTQLALDEEVYEKTRLNDERREKEIRLFISRFRAKARLANLVQSRIKTLAKMEKKEKLQALKDLEFSFRSQPLKSKQVLSVNSLSFAYDTSHPLIRGLDLSVTRGDRICVIGKNGKGKTTLLKLLASLLTPVEGQITYNPGVVMGFYEQTNISSLVDSRTVEEEILLAHDDVDRQLARNICGAMLFAGDAALKRIEVLSGGEKARVMLGQLLVRPINLLLLDEPTNHLDMASCDALLAALDNFEGTVIMVTHNEMFLHALATRLIVFQEAGLQIFEGSYQAFLESGGWEDEGDGGRASGLHPAPGEKVTRVNKRELRRLRSDIITEKARVLRPIEDNIAANEAAIEAAEKQLAILNQEMQHATQTQDSRRIAELGQKIHACQSQIDVHFAHLEPLYTKQEEAAAHFNEKLAELSQSLSET